MSLRTKFNLSVLVAFLIGFCITGLLLKQHFEDSARAEALRTASVMIAAANAVRNYTTDQILPLIGNERDGKFLAVSIPSFAAQTNFRAIGTSFGDYRYKEAALNPTNPADRATDWEADIINEFRANTGRQQIVSERETPMGAMMNVARPIKVSEDACLMCHSVPSAAPASMIKLYGGSNGFGWHRNEIIGAQIASLPLAGVMAKAHWSLFIFLSLLTGVFVLMLVIMNLLLHYLVIKPVKTMSKIATEVSLGNMHVEEFKATGADEISTLSAAFNRMRRSLASAMSMLEESKPSAT